MNEITCPSCNHVNEASRVFCHNCGVRLPRPDKMVAEVVKANEEADKAAKELRRRGGKKKRVPINWSELFASSVASVFKLGVTGFFIALLILMSRPADNLPAPAAPNPELMAAGDRQLEAAAAPEYKGKISATGEQISQYLATKVRLEGKLLGLFGNVETGPPAILLENNRFTLSAQYRIAGMPLSVQTTFQPAGNSLSVVSGAIGRLQLPGWVFGKVFAWYRPMGEVLASQLDALSKAKSIEITPELVTATW